MSLSIRKIGLSVLAASLLIGCFSYNEDILVGGQAEAPATKIINSSRSAVEGCLLIKFNEKATLAFEKGSKSHEVSRSNIEPLNIALNKIGAVTIERVFPFVEKHEEETRKAGLHRWYIVRFDSDENLENAAKTLASIEDIDMIQYNTRLSHKPSKAIPADDTPSTRLTVSEVNDPYFKYQWHYYNTGTGIHDKQVAGMDINVKDAWRYCTGDPSIVVAVIDEGVDYTHEDLADNMWVNVDEIPGNNKDDDNNGYVDDIHGYNHVSNGGISWDLNGDSGHGTHIAGTIAAVNNNGKGVCGIAGGDGSGNGVRIMSSQKFSGKNRGTISSTANAIKYAADNGAVIAQCSWGIEGGEVSSDKQFTSAVGWGVAYDAILAFQRRKNSDVLDGGLVIFAAGNDSLNMSGYPAAYREYISVAATGCDGLPTWYTNFGPGTNISAPGGDTKTHGDKGSILSTMPKNNAISGYGYMDGTSMACPHVSGVAALGLSYAKKLGKRFSLEEFTAMLLLSVNDIDADLEASSKFFPYVGKMGSGRIDAFRMLMNVEGTPCIYVTKGKTNYIDLAPYIADGVADIMIQSSSEPKNNISTEDYTKLGVKGGPVIQNGQLIIRCENTGCGFINVPVIVGGKTPGDEDTMGGRVTIKKIAIIVRESHAANGGWL